MCAWQGIYSGCAGIPIGYQIPGCMLSLYSADTHPCKVFVVLCGALRHCGFDSFFGAVLHEDASRFEWLLRAM